MGNACDSQAGLQRSRLISQAEWGAESLATAEIEGLLQRSRLISQAE